MQYDYCLLCDRPTFSGPCVDHGTPYQQEQAIREKASNV